MRQLNTSYHNEMAGYLMDFGFGGFVGYGGGVLVKNGGTELSRWFRECFYKHTL